MATEDLITVTLYSKENCPLCETAKEDLASLQEELPHRLIVVDIESEGYLREKYHESIPVIEVGPFTKRAPFTRDELKVTLLAAQDRVSQLEKVQDPDYQRRKARGRTVSKTDKFSYWLTTHYLKALNILVIIYLGLPFLAPVLMNNGMTGPASLIYRVYGAVCHQFAFRSWFLYGDQIAYPRAAAGVAGLVPYGQATGQDEADILAARAYIGGEDVGYKVAFCERDVAIYSGILVFGLLFGLLGRRLKSLPWYLWILIGVAPIAIDGFSQLLSQPPFSFWPYRESTPFLRTLTGFLFGFATAWLGYPMIEAAMRDTRQALLVKFSRAE